MPILNRFDPWVVPLLSYRVALPFKATEAAERVLPLVAAPLEATTEQRPFRGEVKDGEARLTVRVPTSGVASGVIQHERALAVVHVRFSDSDGGSELELVVRQPLPAFVVLLLVWIGFIFTVVRGAEPVLLFMPISGHAILLIFFRMTARERALGPLSRVLGEKL